MSVLGSLHERAVYGRRVRVLSERLAALCPQGASVLDVGCGDGLITRLVGEHRPDLRLQGMDVMERPHPHVPVTLFDGRVIPFPDDAFDTVMMVDVLHHTGDPAVLLAEAARVARRTVLLKDHTRDGWLAGPTLRLMDWVGNAPHGVVLPYNYWTEAQWRGAFRSLDLDVLAWEADLPLYPAPASWLFGRSLHFLASLGTP
ncbi:MAG TPA: class I SAM-dependent methyltransferase [Longimicrobiales bacterium]|nr:class I SAM-dependent methyltransferase [Longimicrobiales bacterium]